MERTYATALGQMAQKKIQAVRQDRILEVSYMTYAQKMLDERSAGYRMGHREGLEAGREKGLVEGREKGLVEGREKGRTETLTQVVRRMQELGFDDSAIAKATGYPIETIQKIHE